MASKRIRDILDHVRAFKHHLVEIYEHLSETEHDERLKLLLHYLGRHEEQIEKTLDRYENDVSEGILNTWVRFVDDEALRTIFHDVEIHSGMTPDEVIDAALRFDASLLQVYRDVADSTAATHVQEAFTNLAEMEENKDHQYARSLLE